MYKPFVLYQIRPVLTQKKCFTSKSGSSSAQGRSIDSNISSFQRKVYPTCYNLPVEIKRVCGQQRKTIAYIVINTNRWGQIYFYMGFPVTGRGSDTTRHSSLKNLLSQVYIQVTLQDKISQIVQPSITKLLPPIDHGDARCRARPFQWQNSRKIAIHIWTNLSQLLGWRLYQLTYKYTLNMHDETRVIVDRFHHNCQLLIRNVQSNC